MSWDGGEGGGELLYNIKYAPRLIFLDHNISVFTKKYLSHAIKGVVIIKSLAH